MLHFFRSIRQKLFQQGKVKAYLGYAIGEIVLIVLGIMVAVQIGEWNQARKDYAEIAISRQTWTKCFPAQSWRIWLQ